MKRLTVLGAVIVLGLACGGDEGDGAVMLVPEGDEPDCGPGNLVAFIWDDIYYCDEYGRKVVRVTDSEEIFEENPCWSPDGQYIAYEAYDGRIETGGIFVISKDGGEPTQLTADRGGRPAWSPDGLTIAYNDAEDYDIWAVPAAGGEPERLTARGHCSRPCWSADGEHIYFAAPNPKELVGPYTLYYFDVDSRETVALWTYDGPLYDLAASPDGRWLAGVFNEIGASEDIWLIHVKTGKRYRLTNEPEPDYDGD